MSLKRAQLIRNPVFLSGILVIIVLVITAQSILQKPKTFEPGGLPYTHYNNYVIFKQSFFHLIENKDLYKLYPIEHWDYYKYSPAFSLLMFPLANLPDAFGLFFWNLLNVLVLFFALWKLPFTTRKNCLYLFGFILIELIGSTQNAQSNALIAGLVIFAFNFLEKKKIALASLCIVLTIFIKLFGIVALTIFIFYPGKLKAILYTIMWTLLFAVLPLAVVSFSQLSFLYQSWFHLLQNDHDGSLGLSVQGWVSSWFGFANKNLVVIVGALLLCVPLVKHKFFRDLRFKLFFLSSALIWMVIFNHKAESPTFIIAIAGAAIWFFYQEIKIENMVLLLLAFVFTILSSTGIFPKNFRSNYILPYVLKAVPCILIWFKITWDLIFYRPEKYLYSTNLLKKSTSVF